MGSKSQVDALAQVQARERVPQAVGCKPTGMAQRLADHSAEDPGTDVRQVDEATVG